MHFYEATIMFLTIHLPLILLVYWMDGQPARAAKAFSDRCNRNMARIILEARDEEAASHRAAAADLLREVEELTAISRSDVKVTR